MRVTIETIPHESQRYDTCGDWLWEDGRLKILVSETGNEDYNFLVAVHEFVEAYLCERNGINEAAVTAFDMAYEATRIPGDQTEPGDSHEAPYHSQHRLATVIERDLAGMLGVGWWDYEDAISAL